MVIIAKAREGFVKNKQGKRVRTTSRYPQACLEILPEEVLQWIFVYIAATPVPDCWTVNVAVAVV
jgi:hypothetical protein